MSPRLPVESGFSDVKLSIVPPPEDKRPVNALCLLHGLGDTKEPFKVLGAQLNLPETVCVSIQGPNPVPFYDNGAQWGDDLIFDSSTGDLDLDTGFKTSTPLLQKIVQSLIDKCGFTSQDVYFFGNGQGGMAALAAAAALPASGELGGIISVGGPMPDCDYPITKSKTPILVLGGSQDSKVSRANVERIERVFTFVQYHKWNRPGDAMPRNREEMLPIMEFLSRRLKSRQGVPEGSVELT